MNSNRGKQFEVQVKQGLEKVDGITFDRFIDPTAGFKGVCNVCDFVAYKYPTIFYIECKSCSCNTFSWKNITDNQWKGLIEKDKIKGVVAGFLIWYIANDITVFITASAAEKLRKCKTSINSKKFEEQFPEGGFFVLDCVKRRVLFDYDMSKLFDDLQKYEESRIKDEYTL